MAMTKCKECGAALSTKAAACPQCGAKIKRTSVMTWLVTGFLGLVVVSTLPAILNGREAADKRQAEQAAAEAAKSPEQRKAEAEQKAKREAEFQRVVAVAKGVKAGMKNPASFELVDGLYMADGTVCLTYRGTNSFNAVVTQQTGIDPKNKVVDWNGRCGGKTGTSYAHARAAF